MALTAHVSQPTLSGMASANGLNPKFALTIDADVGKHRATADAAHAELQHPAFKPDMGQEIARRPAVDFVEFIRTAHGLSFQKGQAAEQKKYGNLRLRGTRRMRQVRTQLDAELAQRKVRRVGRYPVNRNSNRAFKRRERRLPGSGLKQEHFVTHSCSKKFESRCLFGIHLVLFKKVTHIFRSEGVPKSIFCIFFRFFLETGCCRLSVTRFSLTKYEMLQPATTRFTILSSSRSLPPLPAFATEIIISSAEPKSWTPAKQSSDVARWKGETTDQFERKRKELEAPKGHPSEIDEAQTIRVFFADGAQSVWVGLDPKTSVFEQNQRLRKAVEDLIVAARVQAASSKKSGSTLRLDVRGLSDEMGSRLLKSFGFLCSSAGWKPHRFGNQATKAPQSDALNIEILSSLKSAQEILERGAALGNANNRVRTLASLPTNELGPKAYRALAADIAKAAGLKFEFLDYAELEKRKAGAFLAVARADRQGGAGIARITYTPKKSGKSKKAPLILVGKGICFDTGGYNVKTGGHMFGMHGDMTGSAIALSLISFFAETEADFEVIAYMALAENLISPSAFKPNEVVIASDGTAIEVVDTDAEGRMILADTLAFARKDKPFLALDFATLTGAAIRSLDTRRGAVFSNQPELAAAAVLAGERSGERVWSFPLGDDYRRELKSKVADILQCGPGNNADHIYAATFLSHFVGDETPWIHLDLVPAENKGGLGLVSSDTTGFGLAWAEELITHRKP